MSINIYPAHVVEGKEVNHADNWDENSTMNLANANFYSLAKELNLEHLMIVPGHMNLKVLELSIQIHHSPRYHERLKKLCAQAHVLKARYIVFS